MPVAAPAAIAAPARHHASGTPRSRRPDVSVAVPSMTATKAAARPACSNTSVTTAPTAAS